VLTKARNKSDEFGNVNHLGSARHVWACALRGTKTTIYGVVEPPEFGALHLVGPDGLVSRRPQRNPSSAHCSSWPWVHALPDNIDQKAYLWIRFRRFNLLDGP
jgi:hypothetical protein